MPVLRAGLGMVDGFLRLLPDARVGHLGMARDEAAHTPVDYYSRLPPGLADAWVFVLDPMLATGGSAVNALQHLKECGRQASRARVPGVGAGGHRGGQAAPTPTSGSGLPPSTAGWMRTPTSGLAWAMPATGCSARSERAQVRSGRSGLRAIEPLVECLRLVLSHALEQLGG